MPELQPSEFRARRLALFKKTWAKCQRDAVDFQEHVAAFEAAVVLQAALGPFSLPLPGVARIRTGDPDAEFWLQRRGTDRNVGRPTRDGRYSQYNIGIRVTQPQIVAPDYLYYWFEMLWMKGYWERFSYGTLPLQHIRARDVCNLKVTYR